MNKQEVKGRIAYEALVFLGAIALLTLITRLWPILFLVIVVMLVCVLRLMFIRVKTVKAIAPATPTPESPPVETEISIITKAFGLLQRRISEQLEAQYPGARWVWSATNTIEHFKMGEPMIILLNRAGGYQKAQVVVHNLLFKGLDYLTVKTPVASVAPVTPPKTETPEILDGDDGAEVEEPLPDEAPVNYGRLAFEWVDANMADINARYNESIAQSQSEMLIPSEELPHPDSWPDVCAELKRNGFTAADFCEDGIQVNVTQ